MIRRLTEADKDIYMALAREFYSSDAVLHDVPQSYIENTFAEMRRSGDYAQGFIMEAEGETAGYALLSFTWSQEAGGKVCWIEELYLREKFRGKGMGHEFFAFLNEHIAPECARLRLEVEEENTRARALYERLGYEVLPYMQMIIEK